jgi:MerR HTH family regulatory protein
VIARVLEIGPVAGEPSIEAELTIDELAADSRIPSRTIRFYQQKGVLLPPVIKGRVAYYGPRHKERLELKPRPGLVHLGSHGRGASKGSR